jgi:ubiquitin-activating enzyme E1
MKDPTTEPHFNLLTTPPSSYIFHVSLPYRLRGLGVEIAKNVILAGVKSVTLADDAPVEMADLSSQFYFTEADVGTPRAQACGAQLAELNNYVQVATATNAGALADVSRYSCVVVADCLDANTKLRVSDLCHAANVPYVQGDTRGLFASVFCDFGRDFVVTDANAEQPKVVMVANIQSDADEAECMVGEERRHGLEDGDCITFHEVPGPMGAVLNGCEPRPIKVKTPYVFTIGSTRGIGDFDLACGIPAIATQVKMPQKHSFKSLRESLTAPGEFLCVDFAKVESPAILHQAFRGLDEFAARHGGLPAAGDRAQAEEVYQLTCRVNGESKEGDFKLPYQNGYWGETGVGMLTAKPPAAAAAAAGTGTEGEESDAAKKAKNYEKARHLIMQLAMGARGQLSPICAAMGGIVGQEVLKACSGKFMPLKQWLYMDAIECLPSGDKWPLPAVEYAPAGNRYDGQVAVFGRAFQQKLQNQSLFLVGAGAIGCEMLKNWAMMGIATGGAGGGASKSSSSSSSTDLPTISITDMDTIEKSNLNRQFLFRPSDVGQAKSTTAARAATAMNPAVRVRAFEDRVGADTEGTFNDEFFEDLDGVITALDNREARLYVDQRCMYYRKPMIDSGTLGTKGNTQVVLPSESENWGASRDAPDVSIPICTLKNFPYQIEHTIQWARDFFEGTFTQTAMDANQYLTNPDFLAQLDAQQNTKIDTLERLKDSLVDNLPTSFAECVQWARLRFEHLFLATTAQLLHNFPKDQTTASGQPFWSGHKRFPEVLKFDAGDPTHMAFIVAASNLRAHNYGIQVRIAVPPKSSFVLVGVVVVGIFCVLVLPPPYHHPLLNTE